MILSLRVGGVALALSFALGACSSSSSAPSGGALSDAGAIDAAPEPSPDIVAASIPGLKGSTFSTEPSLAVAPNGAVALAYLDIKAGFASTAVVLSTDRGETWSAPQRIALPDSRFGSNEIVQADQDGSFFLVTLGVAPDASGSKVYITKAAAGETTFGPPVEISDPALPKGIRDASAFSIAQDRSLNVVWMEADGANATIVAARSTDGGATWARTTISPNGSWPNVCASRDSGGVVAVYVDDLSRATGFRWSDDNGATWPAANHNEVPFKSGHYPGEFPSCVTEGSDVWVLQGISTSPASRSVEPTLIDVALTHSADRGHTLDPVISPVDPQAGPKYMRAMAAIQLDHTTSLVYYAGAKDDDTQATVRRSVSSDGAKTFGPSEILFSPFVLTTSRMGHNWPGDLLAVTSDSRNTFVAFVDNQSGRSRIRFSRLGLSPKP